MHIGLIEVHDVSMQDMPDGYSGIIGMTGDTPQNCTGIVLYQSQHYLLIVWRFYSSLKFLCVHDEGSSVGQSMEQACKKSVPEFTFWSNVGRTTILPLGLPSQLPRMPDAYQQTHL
ncbi:uncharacterized protein TNCV_1331021 [Trichonephila clavipes]|uniref:Uncharacterized protein n=1 Tax=Trichonephila clavipes TaxID=2585209 RepID=A0A8X6UPS1_TRICX|nr:uncharacterized protein TNCV_1331021 [Trichonephila clavipes]